MPDPVPSEEMSIRLAVDLDAGTVSATHARLVSLLDAVETSEATASLELAADGEVSPLSMQLLFSAQQSFPSGRLSLGPQAAGALTAFAQSKEI